MANIHFIRAAIESATGVKLTLEQTKEYLVSEGMLSKSKAEKLIFKGYSGYYDPVEERPEEKIKDMVELIEEKEIIA